MSFEKASLASRDADMRARRLIEQQDYLGPESLLAVTAAFEAAWASVQGDYADGAARDGARLRLATIVIDLARQGIGADELQAIAVEVMGKPLN